MRAQICGWDVSRPHEISDRRRGARNPGRELECRGLERVADRAYGLETLERLADDTCRAGERGLDPGKLRARAWRGDPPERKAEVALEGTPGRTMIVGSLRIRPSTKPRREYSLIRSSDINLPAPYAPSGVAIVSGVITSGWVNSAGRDVRVSGSSARWTRGLTSCPP